MIITGESKKKNIKNLASQISLNNIPNSISILSGKGGLVLLGVIKQIGVNLHENAISC